MNTPARPCPCGLGATFDACCGRYITLGANPPTAEALMRSRFTAFALGDTAYLRHSWHPLTCPDTLELDPRIEYTSLTVTDTTKGSLFDAEGTVSFIARGVQRSHNKSGNKGNKHHRDNRHRIDNKHSRDKTDAHEFTQREHSRFLRHEGRWVYLDGTEF